MSVLGTDTQADPKALFTGARPQSKWAYTHAMRLDPLLAITALQGLRRFDTAAAVLDLARRVRPWAGA